MYRKNVAGQFVHFQGVDAAAGGIKSGVTWTVRRCIDGTFAVGGGTVTEDGTTGWYKYAMAQADTNGNNIGFNFTGTGAVPQTVNIITTGADPTDAVRLGLTAFPNAATGTAGAVLTAGAGTAQLNVAGGKAPATVAVGDLATGSIARATFAADTGLQPVRSGTAQAGAAGTITLDAGASAVTDAYKETWIKITGGTGPDQSPRLITAYNGTTKVATVAPNWTTNPDVTSTFAILSAGRVAGVEGNVNGTLTTATNLTNLPAIPANWLTAAGIAASALNGKGDWLLASSYTAPPTTAAIATAIWQDLLAGADFGTAGSIGALLKLDIDAAISSRSTYNGTDTTGVTTLLGRIASALTITGGKVDVNDKTGFSLSGAGLDAVLVESGIVAGPGLTNDAAAQLVSINARQALSLALSALAGVLAGAATTTVTIAPGGLPAGNTRVSATVDANGNRTALTLKVPT